MGPLTFASANYDTYIVPKVKQSCVQLSCYGVEATQTPVQPLVDGVTTVRGLQHGPLRLRQELRHQ